MLLLLSILAQWLLRGEPGGPVPAIPLNPDRGAEAISNVELDPPPAGDVESITGQRLVRTEQLGALIFHGVSGLR